MRGSYLYDIRGGGGGNFGIITKYYFNTVNDPEYPFCFHLFFPLKTREDIINAHTAFKNIFDDFPSISSKLNNEQNHFPYFFAIRFFCIYLPSTANEINFNQIINKFTYYMKSGYVATEINYYN